MKKTLKLIPAFAMLLVSAILVSTATFAWFSMNDTVSVTGMKIEAKSNTTYLLISRANVVGTAPANAAAIQAENGGIGYTSVNFTVPASSSAVFPVAPASALTTGSGATHTDFVAGASATPAYWYTMVGTNPTSSGYVGQANTERDVTSSANVFAGNEYALHYRFYFTIAKNSNPAINLVVDEITISGDAAVRCLVVGTNGSALYSASTTDDSLALESNLDDDNVYSVDVYVYYDGNEDTIYTNNIPSIADGEVSLTFKVTAAG